MPRLTKLDDVLFPVEEHPVFASFTEKGVERRLAVPGKKAIVNANTKHVLGIVSRGYRLVSNAEALNMAQKCCHAVFPETKPSEWEARAVDAPSTAGYCLIDLMHNTSALNLGYAWPNQQLDVFSPFIRVTNSFNGLRALRFDIGYSRKICSNGLIISETIISFKFTHVRREIGKTIQFQIKQDRLSAFKTAFTNSLAGLRNCVVQFPQFEPLIRGVLQIQPPKSLEPDTPIAKDWKQLGVHINEMCIRYAGELGNNAYAAFNVITEFASRPPTNRWIHRDRHSLQRLAGSWMTSFNAACHKPGFSIPGYLEELAKERAKTIQLTPEPVTEN